MAVEMVTVADLSSAVSSERNERSIPGPGNTCLKGVTTDSERCGSVS